MSASCCMHHALAIASTPTPAWGGQIERLPAACPSPERCGQPHSCRERVADYLRVQWRMQSKRQGAKAVRA